MTVASRVEELRAIYKMRYGVDAECVVVGGEERREIERLARQIATFPNASGENNPTFMGLAVNRSNHWSYLAVGRLVEEPESK